MAITYASVPLCDPTSGAFPEIETWAEWVENSVSLSRIFPLWERQFRPVIRQLHLTHPGFIPDEPIRLNTLVWPKGASRWAYFNTIVHEEQLKQIRQSVSGGTAASLEMSWYDEKGQQVDQITASMFMLAARPLMQLTLGGGTSPSDGFTSEALYLLTLVDERYRWWFKNTGDIDIDEGTTTWDDLYGDIDSGLGISTGGDSVESVYTKPSAALTSQYEYGPLLLDAVAYNTGLRIVRSLSGTVTAQNPDTAYAAILANIAKTTARSRLGGGTYAYNPLKPNDLNQMVPNTVEVVFPKVECGLLTGDVYTEDTTLTELGLAVFQNATGFDGKKTFRDTLTADYTLGGATPNNSSELTNLITQIAKDYYLWQSMIGDVKYTGIISFDPEGQSDRIEWAHREGDVSTRIIAQRVNDLAFDLFHSSEWSSGETGAGITKSGMITQWADQAFPGSLHFDKKRSWKPTERDISSNQDNYDVPLTPWLRLNCTAACNITGWDGQNEGLTFQMTNVGTANITLKHASGSSSANNQMKLVGNLDLVVLPNGSVTLSYDCDAHKWFVTGGIADRQQTSNSLWFDTPKVVSPMYVPPLPANAADRDWMQMVDLTTASVAIGTATTLDWTEFATSSQTDEYFDSGSDTTSFIMPAAYSGMTHILGWAIAMDWASGAPTAGDQLLLDLMQLGTPISETPIQVERYVAPTAGASYARHAFNGWFAISAAVNASGDDWSLRITNESTASAIRLISGKFWIINLSGAALS